jgi:hypothetical protein
MFVVLCVVYGWMRIVGDHHASVFGSWAVAPVTLLFYLYAGDQGWNIEASHQDSMPSVWTSLILSGILSGIRLLVTALLYYAQFIVFDRGLPSASMRSSSTLVIWYYYRSNLHLSRVTSLCNRFLLLQKGRERPGKISRDKVPETGLILSLKP